MATKNEDIIVIVGSFCIVPVNIRFYNVNLGQILQKLHIFCALAFGAHTIFLEDIVYHSSALQNLTFYKIRFCEKIWYGRGYK